MKRFVVTILAIAVFFVGLGSLAEHVSAKFKSDEKALDIIRQARIAIGGEAAIAGVRSMVIVGRTSHQIKGNGTERSEQGDSEIVLQFPDKLMKKIQIGKADNAAKKVVVRQHDVVIATKDGAQNVELTGDGSGEFVTPEGRKVVVKEIAPGSQLPEGGEVRVFVRNADNAEPGLTTAQKMAIERKGLAGGMGKSGVRQNEMLKHTLALLLTAPEGMDVSYTFAGESDIDGAPVNIVNAEFGGSSYKLYINKSTSLPVALGFVGMPMPVVMKIKRDAETAASGEKEFEVFAHKMSSAPAAEHLIKFSDYRSTGGVQLPYRWTTLVAGEVRDTFEVTSYDLNPENIAERFEKQEVFVRSKKNGQ